MGSSPPGSLQRGDKGAKKFMDRLRYDYSINPSEYTVGFIESVSVQERKSGVEAWSMRVRDQLKELPFESFTALWGEDEVPYHRIAYFAHGGARVWESEYHKKRVDSGHDLHAAGGSTPIGGRRATGSFTGGPGIPPLPPHHPLGSTPPPGPSFMRRVTKEGLDTPHSLGGLSHGAGGGGTASEDNGSDSEDDDGGSSDDDDPCMMGQQLDEEIQEEAERQLPEECWIKILTQIDVREICMLGRVNAWLRQLAASPCVWEERHRVMFGEPAPPSWNAATVRRMCRRSALKAARWVEAHIESRSVGYANTGVLQFDDSKVVSADGSALRLWSHATGRRIATLQGHAGRVTCLAFDEEHVASGCTQSAVKLWSIDDLKCVRTLRGHDGAVTGVALMPGGIPVSCGEDAHIKLWDIATSSPIVDLLSPWPVNAVHVQQATGYLVSAGGGIQIWDAGSAQLLHTLGGDAGEAGDSSDDEVAALLGAELEGAGHPHAPPAPAYTALAYNGALLAAGRPGSVVLWDTRDCRQIGTLLPEAPPPGSVPASASSPGAALPACAGVQLDDWKLVVGFNHGSGAGGYLSVHDIRAAGKAVSGSTWSRPLVTLPAPSRINCFQFNNQELLTGLEGNECMLWSMAPPTAAHHHDGSGGGYGYGLGGRGGADEFPGPRSYGRSSSRDLDAGAHEGVSGSAKKDKKKKQPKKSAGLPRRYPKRSTK